MKRDHAKVFACISFRRSSRVARSDRPMSRLRSRRRRLFSAELRSMAQRATRRTPIWSAGGDPSTTRCWHASSSRRLREISICSRPARVSLRHVLASAARTPRCCRADRSADRRRRPTSPRDRRKAGLRAPCPGSSAKRKPMTSASARAGKSTCSGAGMPRAMRRAPIGKHRLRPRSPRG